MVSLPGTASMERMVLVLGVSAGAYGARAVVAHSDQPQLTPIDQCVVSREAGAGLDQPVAIAIDQMRNAALARGEVISAATVASRGGPQDTTLRSAAETTWRGPVQMIEEASAQLRYLRFLELLPNAGTVIFYDLGSSGLTLTQLDCATGRITQPRRSTLLGGDRYDTLLQWKLASSGVVADADTVRAYKEVLSEEKLVTAQDRRSGHRMVVTRGDFAKMTIEGITESAGLVRQLVASSKEPPLGVVLLGGSTRNPSIKESLQSAIGLPIIEVAEPELISARGAVLMADDRPGRVVRVARALGAGAPRAGQTSRRKLIAAVAATLVLAATVTGLAVVRERSAQSQQPIPHHAPSEVAEIR